ncbi:MAG: hypothetical protein FRC54_07200 [bacterium LCO1.1]|uniref:Uncharacterized protein n=1 Tax=Candidatus Weimeria bifida TaxID=2599074 RepID=A0A6N7IZF9_9FIRM|nr:hypothetical protein [Candidatus Weimeria bifida]
MKKFKRIFGIVAVCLLVFMYVLTLVFAIIDNPHTMTMFKACIAATVVIPVMLWVIGIFMRIAKPDNREFNDANRKKD